MPKTMIVQTSFNAGELSPHMAARTDQGRYVAGCRSLKNMLVLPHGPAYRRPGTEYMGEASRAASQGAARLIPFVFNTSQTYVLEVTHKCIRFWHKQGLITDINNAALTLATPYAGEHVNSLRFCQSADVLYMVSPHYPPHRLERRSHTNWSIVPLAFQASQEPPELTSLVVTGSAQREYAYVVTAVNNETDEESLPCLVKTCMAASSLNTGNYTTLSWKEADNAREYRIYRGDAGVGNYGLIGRATGTSYTDRGQAADFSVGAPQSKAVFTKEGSYPMTVQFYQQRLCFGGALEAPQTIWTSRSGNYHNMNISYPLQADDACTVTIAAERVSQINWMLGGKTLLVGTEDGEWSISGYGSEPLAPNSCQVERYGSYGSASLPAITLGDTVMYVQRGGRVVRELRYALDSDSYASTNLSLLAEHFFLGRRIVDWVWQQSPHSVLWCVLDNGTLVGLTFIREHSVVSWHRHETQGFVEAVTVIPGEEDDELWLLVRRTRNLQNGESESFLSVERLAPMFRSDKAEDAFFVDCGLTWRGAPVTRLVGLHHLEGKEVQLLANGMVLPPRVVQNGAVTLDFPASVVHVGLGYTSDIIPMMTEPVEFQGKSLGMARRVGRVRLALYDSLGGQVGAEGGSMRPLLLRTVRQPLGSSSELYSGEHSVLVDAVISTRGGVCFRQAEPLPFTLTAVSCEVEIGEM